MLILLAIFSVCAVGIAILLSAILMGRLVYQLFLELRRSRLAVQQLIIAERENNDLLIKLVVRNYGVIKEEATKKAPPDAPDTQNAPLE